LVFLFALCFVAGFIGVRRRREDEIPLAPSVTTSINGIFVLLVLLSHFYQYAGKYINQNSYVIARDYSGQTIVATFLFFSGYGIMHQILKKKRAYARKMVTHRLLKVLLHFDLAMILFWILGWYCGKADYDPILLLKAAIGWSKLSIGNSNWFIFATLCLYLIVFIAFFFYKEKPLPCLVAVVVLTCLYIFLIMQSENNTSRFYNTIFCFVGGMWFCYLEKPIRSFLRKSNLVYYTVGAVLVVTATVSCLLFTGSREPLFWILYNIYALSVALIFVWLSEKLVFGNAFMLWLGKYTFPIYILQRIPCLFLRQVGVLEQSRVLYLVLCLAITAALAISFQFVTDRLDRLIWSKTETKSKRK